MRLLEIYDEMRDSLKVSVKIDSNEVDKIVVRALINKRNSPSCKIREHFDKVLKDYYLSESEFEQHVINGVAIE